MISLKQFALIASIAGFSSTASASIITVDPDSFAAGTILNNAFPGITLTAIGDPGVLLNGNVLSAVDTYASTGSMVFADTSGSSNYWGNGSYSALRVDFASGTTQVWLDFVANDSDSNPFIEAYDTGDNLLASALGGSYTAGNGVTLSVAAPNIAYIKASWDQVSKVDNGTLDNLRYTVPEPGTLALLGLGLAGLAARHRRKQ